MTTYNTSNDLVYDVDRTLADNAQYYGDFGFDFRIEWNGNSVSNIEVSWPSLTRSYVLDSYRFAEALGALCFELNSFVGAEVAD